MVIKEALLSGRRRLEKAGVPDAETDVFLLLEAAADVSRAFCLAHPEAELSEKQQDLFEGFLRRREKREPCQYIIGSTEFYGIPFEVDPNVLIPRQDTEVLVEEALSVLEKGAEVLDLCTGSGAIAVAVKKMRPDAEVSASDLSEAALGVAEKNCRQNQCDVRLLRGDLFEAVPEGQRFDLIVSNPPYVSEGEYAQLMPEVRDHEPSLALLAGEDGLFIYRRLVGKAPSFLKPGGWLMVEIGCFQGKDVADLFETAGFTDVQVKKDLAGLDRVVSGKLPA